MKKPKLSKKTSKKIEKQIEKLKIKFHPDTFYLIKLQKAVPWPVENAN